MTILKKASAFPSALFCSIALIVFPFFSNAQFKRNSGEKHWALGASIGVRQQSVNSNFAEIDNLKVLQEGGTIFAAAGNRVISASIFSGFYYSASSVPQTIDLIEVGSALKLHPLQLGQRHRSRWSPYVLAGISMNHHRFFGFYGENDPGYKNRSVGLEPYVGRLRVINADAGLGLEYQILFKNQFINFFLEAYKSIDVNTKATRSLTATTLTDANALKLGMIFGFRR